MNNQTPVTENVGVNGPALIAEYEELRSQAIEGSGRGFGLTLFLQRGMRAWVDAWCECKTAAPRSTANSGVTARTCVLPMSSELAILLAGLTLNHYEEAR
jgi:hypothetical protein